MMDFLYFPDDKAEYIPAIIMLVIFSIGAVVTMYLLVKVSRKEEKKADEKFQSQKITEETEHK